MLITAVNISAAVSTFKMNQNQHHLELCQVLRHFKDSVLMVVGWLQLPCSALAVIGCETFASLVFACKLASSSREVLD